MNKNNIKKSPKPKSWKDIAFTTALIAIPVLALLMAGGLLYLYIGIAGHELGSHEQFAQFGDFVGGALNPILAFLTILLLIISIRFQIEELRATREELSDNNEIARENIMAQELIFARQRIIAEFDNINEMMAQAVSVKFLHFSTHRTKGETITNVLARKNLYEEIDQVPEFEKQLVEVSGDIEEISATYNNLLFLIVEKKIDTDLFQSQIFEAKRSIKSVVASFRVHWPRANNVISSESDEPHSVFYYHVVQTLYFSEKSQNMIKKIQQAKYLNP